MPRFSPDKNRFLLSLLSATSRRSTTVLSRRSSISNASSHCVATTIENHARSSGSELNITRPSPLLKPTHPRLENSSAHGNDTEPPSRGRRLYPRRRRRRHDRLFHHAVLLQAGNGKRRRTRQRVQPSAVYARSPPAQCRGDGACAWIWAEMVRDMLD